MLRLDQERGNGSPDALDGTMPVTCDELRGLAMAYEVYPLRGQKQGNNRSQLLAIAARMIRRGLVDHSTRRHALLDSEAIDGQKTRHWLARRLDGQA